MTPLHAQVAVVVTAFGLKPFYMLGAAVLLWVLRSATSPGLRRIRLGMTVFLAGEIACAGNYLAFGGCSDPLEAVHGLGMAVMGGLLAHGLFALVDPVLRLTDPATPCVGIRACGTCSKREDGPCPIHRILTLAAPCCAVLALVPFTAPLEETARTLDILGSPVLFAYPMAQQVLELRVMPGIGALLLAVASIQLVRRDIRLSEPWFFAGFGFLTFALLRFFLSQALHAVPPWADAWEEITEAMMVGGLGWMLWVTRGRLDA